MIKAFIFDLDGVITDTAHLHFQSWKACAEKIGISIDQQVNERLKGVGRMESLEYILKIAGKQDDFTEDEKTALITEKNEHYLELIAHLQYDDILPGIRQLLNEIKNADYRLAIASASKNAPFVLESLGIINLFDAIADPSTVKYGKPAPDIFLQAADLLEVLPHEAIGIEDAVSGIQAIKRAGMFSVGVGDKHYLKDADYVVQSTIELSLESILNAWMDHGERGEMGEGGRGGNMGKAENSGRN